jgi:hypothetical protein
VENAMNDTQNPVDEDNPVVEYIAHCMDCGVKIVWSSDEDERPTCNACYYRDNV